MSAWPQESYPSGYRGTPALGQGPGGRGGQGPGGRGDPGAEQPLYPGGGGSGDPHHQYSQHHAHQTSPPAAGRLPRTISSTNLQKLESCRDYIRNDLIREPPIGGVNFFYRNPQYTLTFPTLDRQQPDFKQFMLNQVVDRTVEKYLEEEHVLNWCKSTTRLHPLNTQPDGNCLCHAASLAMWGVQDRMLVLRQSLSHALSYTDNTLYQRWKFSREVENSQLQLQLEVHQWEDEWAEVVRQASPGPAPSSPASSQRGKNYESLGDFHIFILANVLRRPVILYAVPKVRSLQGGGTLQEDHLQGVYLPLLWDPNVCIKDPLPLAYYGGHFSALVLDTASPRSKDGFFVLPLVDYCGKQLVNKFSLQMEDQTSLVMDYLSPIQIHSSDSPYITASHVVCARLGVAESPGHIQAMVSSFVDACSGAYASRARESMQNPMYRGPGGAEERGGGGRNGGGGGGRGEEVTGKTKCVNHCGRYGDAAHHFMCQECYCKQMQAMGGGGGGGGQLEDARRGNNGQGEPPLPAAEKTKCVNHCGRYGDAEHHFMCPECFRRAQQDATGVVEDRQNQLDQPSPPHNSPSRAESRGHVNHFGAGGAVPGAIGGGGGSSLGAVKCPSCSEPGFPQLMGMCKRCYDNNTAPQEKDPLYETLPNVGGGAGNWGPEGQIPPVLPMPRNPNEKSKCRWPGCNFYGAEEFRYYCSKCFDTHMEVILKEADEGLPFYPLSFSPTPPGESAHPHAQQQQQQQQQQMPRQHSGGSTASNEPPKCPRCQQFYANDEFGGLCNDCFMKSTLPGGTPAMPAPSKQQQQQFSPGGAGAVGGGGGGRGGGGGGNIRMYTEPHPVRRQGQEDRRHSTASQGGQYRDRSGFPAASMATGGGGGGGEGMRQHEEMSGPHASTRIPNITAPVATLASQLSDMSVGSSAACFMCLGGQLGGSSHYSICRKHAADLCKLLPQDKQAAWGGAGGGAGEGWGGGEREEGRRRSSGGGSEGSLERGQHGEFRYIRNPSYDVPGSGGGGGRGGDGGGSGHPYPPQQYRNGGGAGVRDRGQYGGQDYPPRSPPPPSQGAHHHYEQGYPPQQQSGPYGNELEESFSPDPHTQGAHFLPGPQTQGGAGPGRHGGEHYPPDPQGRRDQQHYPPNSRGARGGGDQHGYVNVDPRYNQPSEPQGGGGAGGGASVGGAEGGATGGGAEGGAVGDGGGAQKLKSLCASVGCSFKGYPQLHNLCPDCYKEQYHQPDFDSADFPLV